MAVAAQHRITAEEYERRAGCASASELVRGEVVPVSPAGWSHNRITAFLTLRLGTWAEQTGLGRVLTNETGIITSRDPDTVRGAAVAYFSFARVPRGAGPRGFVSVPPELIVEVRGIDDTWKRLVAKAGEYIAMGVERVWLVDPEPRTLHVVSADGPVAVLHENDILTDERVLPGFSLEIARIFVE